MNTLLLILQQVDIEEKINNAPDKGYEIGVFIGSMLPFVIIVIIAYALFSYSKKRMNKEND